MNDTKITKDRIRNHFAYGWWKYALLALAAVFGWNLIFTTTAYRAPRDKRLDVYFVTYSVPSESLEWFRAQALSTISDLEDANCISVVYTEDDSYYGSMQLTTYIGAGEGDIYVLSKDRFDAFKESGVFITLDDAIASGTIDLRGIDATGGVSTDETGKTGVFGIPADSLYGFMEKNIDNRGLYLCVTAYSANQEKALQYIDWLIESMQAPKPGWLLEQEAQKPQAGTTQAPSDMPSF